MASTENPFTAHIASCNDDPTKIQELYATTRSARNTRGRADLLSDGFEGWKVDEILSKLDGPGRDPSFVDPRHSITICASPPAHVKRMIGAIQQQLQEFCRHIWIAPHNNLHITTLEVTNSKTHEEVEAIMGQLGKVLPDIARCTMDKQPRLVKPMVNLGSAGLALSFEPAAQVAADRYTYHHLRRDIFSIVAGSGVHVGSRYFVPSAHVTIARFMTQDGFLLEGPNQDGHEGIDHSRIHEFVARIDSVNEWLRTEFWPRDDGTFPPGGEWVIGKDKGLECRKGRIWYGGGEDVLASKAYEYRN